MSTAVATSLLLGRGPGLRGAWSPLTRGRRGLSPIMTHVRWHDHLPCRVTGDGDRSGVNGGEWRFREVAAGFRHGKGA
ncbi:hypothetical protein GCM10023223_06540 [Stackebrandtia albiflava]